MKPPLSHLILKNRAIEKIRDFFRKEEIPEVSTPLLVKSGAIEPYLDTFEISGSRCLPTSPEFSLKKMAAIEPSHTKGIYEIAHAFRNEALSKSHLHEFLMVEWYRRQSTLSALSADITAIVKQLASIQPDLVCNTALLTPSGKIESLTISELFQGAFGRPVEPDFKAADYQRIAQSANISLSLSEKTPEEDRLTSIFSTLFDEATRLVFAQPEKIAFVQDFPPQLRGMALLQNGWAKRIEAFIGATEIASGYLELADPEELRRLWEANNQLRVKLGKKPHPLDEELIALTPHMEGVAGMALGLERTLAAIYSVDEIDQFILKQPR